MYGRQIKHTKIKDKKKLKGQKHVTCTIKYQLYLHIVF